MVFNLFLCYFVQLIFKKMAKHFYIIGNFKQYNNMKKEKETYTRYMEYIREIFIKKDASLLNGGLKIMND